MSENNAVLVGQKPAMNYVLACITLFHSGAKEVNIKARGRAISRAVDVVEIVRRKFLPDVEIKNIDIGTQQIQGSEGGNASTNVSTIEIKLTR
ncbi:MAG: DNA-binding protein Alba [Candidatus Bathyarchaeia archaeon]